MQAGRLRHKTWQGNPALLVVHASRVQGPSGYS